MKFFFVFLMIGIFLSGCDKKEEKAEVSSTASKESLMQLCESIESYSETVMRRRQNGTSMSESIRILNNIKINDEGISKTMKEAAEQIIIEAYDISEYSIDENKEEAISDFKNRQFKACYRTLITR